MELLKRKHTRLKDYDYSLPGYYYITIHMQGDDILSVIGDGECPMVTLTPAGWVVHEQLFALEQRYSYVKIDKYVIMPTHLHAIIRLVGECEGTGRSSLTDIVCAFKSLATRQCNQIFQSPGKKWFQTSFYESVLRNEAAYRECWRYIHENPHKWALNPEDR